MGFLQRPAETEDPELAEEFWDYLVPAQKEVDSTIHLWNGLQHYARKRKCVGSKLVRVSFAHE